MSEVPEESEEQPASRSAIGFERYTRFCMAGVVACLALRILLYSGFPIPDFLRALGSQLLHYQIWALLGSYMALVPGLLLGLFLVALLVFRWRWCLVATGSGVAARPWLGAVVWTLLLVYNPAFDVDPFIAAACWSTFPLLFPELLTRFGLRRVWLRVGVLFGLGALLYLFWIAAAEAPGERSTLRFWAVVMVPTVLLGNRWLVPRDRIAVALVLCAATQFVLGESARQEHDHGGTLIGDKDYAYTFCENERRRSLYAAVPCDGSPDGCTDGFIAEHDLDDLSKPAIEHGFFSDDFRGRLVHLVCREDEVIVGMARSQVGGREYQENAMAFQVEDPTQFERSLFGSVIGPRLAYDERHQAVYYTSEWSKKIYRHDLETDTLGHQISDSIYGIGQEPFGSHVVENDSFHEGRDTVTFSQWLTGSKIFEIDRASLELVATYDPLHGGNIAHIVDDETDLIWSTGVWGVDVVDMKTGETRMRSRIGLAPRLPVIDRVHDIVYVPTTAGRLWAFDRRSLERLGSLLVGGGGRNPYVSKDGRHLFAGAQHGYYYWDTEVLARRFKPPAPGSQAGDTSQLE